MISIISMPSFSFAESEIGIYENDIEVQMNPEIPEPYKDVTIKLVSYATDLTKANIEWIVAGKTVLSGYGKTSYITKASGPNTTTNITITITPTNSLDKIVKQISLKPSEIEVLWEAVDGYTPPFYKGKAFLAPEGTIKMVAIPNSSTIKYGKGNISYKWKRNNETDLESSGYNKDYYIFENNPLKTKESIYLNASSVDGAYSAVKNIEVPTYSPKIIFYKKSPTEGILYNEAINNNTKFQEDEITIVAEPYSLGVKDNDQYFTYKWKINDSLIATPSKKTELTIRPTSRGGYATINISIENINKLFQNVAGLLKITL